MRGNLGWPNLITEIGTGILARAAVALKPAAYFEMDVLHDEAPLEYPATPRLDILSEAKAHGIVRAVGCSMRMHLSWVWKIGQK